MSHPPTDSWLGQFLKIEHIEVWVQNLILALTAGIGIWTLRAGARQERRRATVDLVLQGFEDPELVKSRKVLNQLVAKGLDIPYLLSDEGAEDRFAIFTILNRYEFIATGLRERAFDRKVYKQVYYSSAVRDWANVYPLISRFRIEKRRPTAFQEFQNLVDEWTEDPLQRRRLRRRLGRRVLRALVTLARWARELSE